MFSIFILLLVAVAVNSLAISREAVLKPFQSGKALKIISGLHNFDSNNVKDVAWAANNGGATHLDIACDPKLVKIAKSVGTIPVCVSAVDPKLFADAIKAGADMVEIGNFDGFYEQGLDFTANDVLSMAKETRKLFPTVPLSVTIPHRLSLPEQIALAKELETVGADIIQTEGKVAANLGGKGVQELIEIAAPTLAAAYALSRAVSIPVMCASGLTDVTVPLALSAGARGVGIGSMVNKLQTSQQMLLAVCAIAESMGISSKNADEIVLESSQIDALKTSVFDRSTL